MTAKKFRSDLDAALTQAAFVCDFIKVRELLAQGANPDARDEDGRTPLFSAVLGNSVGLLGLLLESGCDVNARDKSGFTALAFAAQERLPEIAHLLISRGADVNAQDDDGCPVLWRAVFSARDQNDVVDLLRKHGAKDDLANKSGETPRALAERLGLNLFSAN